MGDDHVDSMTYDEIYKHGVPRFDDWETAGCVGYFGYANGRAMAVASEMAEKTGQSQETPCTGCPRGQECWDLLKVRAGTVMPALVEKFEELAKTYQGPELMQQWHNLTSVGKPERIVDGGPSVKMKPDPYIALFWWNMEVGALHDAD